jgi:hypothetical protein
LQKFDWNRFLHVTLDALQDMLAVVDIGRAADILLLVFEAGGGDDNASVSAVASIAASSAGAVLNEAGSAVMSVLRALGMPQILGIVQGTGPAASQKLRAGSKKRVEKCLLSQVHCKCFTCSCIICRSNPSVCAVWWRSSSVPCRQPC